MQLGSPECRHGLEEDFWTTVGPASFSDLGISSESASRLGVVAGTTCPVARQRSQGPEQSKQKKQPTPGNAGAPGPERTQGRNDGRGGYTGRPHKGSGSRTGVLHRELFCLHAKEGETLKDPTKSRRPALGIPCSPNGVEQETNAYNPPHEPVSNRVRGEIEKNPCQNHGDDSNRMSSVLTETRSRQTHAARIPAICKILPTAIESRAKTLRSVVAAGFTDPAFKPNLTGNCAGIRNSGRLSRNEPS